MIRFVTCSLRSVAVQNASQKLQESATLLAMAGLCVVDDDSGHDEANGGPTSYVEKIFEYCFPEWYAASVGTALAFCRLADDWLRQLIGDASDVFGTRDALVVETASGVHASSSSSPFGESVSMKVLEMSRRHGSAFADWAGQLGGESDMAAVDDASRGVM
jgi:hypothetical protein